MNKQLVRTKISFAFVTFCVIASLTALFLLNDSTAWFSSNKSVETNGLNIQIKDTEKKVFGIEYYQINSVSTSNKIVDNEEVSYTLYNFEKEPLLESDVKLLEYSELDAKRQLLLKIDLKEEERVTNLNATTQINSYNPETKIIDDNGVEKIDANKFSISSVIQFQLLNPKFQISNNSDTNFDCYGNVKETTDLNIVSEEDLKPAKHFAELNASNNFEIQPTLNFDLQGLTLNCIYFVIDYYEISIQNVLDIVNSNMDSYHFTDFNEADTPQINFICDFTITID